MAHVLFAVNTSILDEAAGDDWTIVGTDLTVKEYLLYAKSPEGKNSLRILVAST
jgi:hypothetical protein